MIQVLGQIDSVTVPEPVAGEPPKPDEATVVVNVHEPYGDGTLTIKLFPAATNELFVGPCRIQVDQG